MDKPRITMTIENPGDLKKKQVADELVEDELDEFDDWVIKTFQGTGHLSSFERAMVKTYIMHKLEKQIMEMPS